MKNQIQWIALVMTFVVGIAGSMGCATMEAEKIVNSGDVDFYFKPVLSDEIVAIGRPDSVLTKELEQPNSVAFIGVKNTYLLHKGGEVLERIAQLKLDGKCMEIDATRSNKLYQRDKQVWGDLVLTYNSKGRAISSEEIAELQREGFVQMNGLYNKPYQKKVSIEGIIYPAIKIPDDLGSRLLTRRPFNLYNPRDAKPPMMPKILKSPLIAAGVAADVALAPVYVGILGFTTVFLVGVIATQ